VLGLPDKFGRRVSFAFNINLFRGNRYCGVNQLLRSLFRNDWSCRISSNTVERGLEMKKTKTCGCNCIKWGQVVAAFFFFFGIAMITNAIFINPEAGLTAVSGTTITLLTMVYCVLED